MALIAVFLFFTTAHAWNNSQNDNQTTGCNEHNPENCPKPSEICGNGEHEGNPHCITPTLEDTPEVTQSPVPTDIPLTVTIQPCGGNLDFWDDAFAVDCITPTLTPTEEVTPTAGESATETPVPPTDTPKQPEITSTPQITLTPCEQSNCGWK